MLEPQVLSVELFVYTNYIGFHIYFKTFAHFIDVIDGVVAMETVHGTPINEFLSQSGIYQ